MGYLDKIELFLYGATLLSIPLSNTATWIWTVLIFLFALYRFFIKRDGHYHRTPLDIAFLSLVGLSFLSIFYSISPQLTLKSFKKLIFFFLYIPTVVYFSRWLKRREIMFKLFSFLIIGGVLTGLYASIKFLLQVEARGKGFFGGPTTLATLMGVLLITALSLGEKNIIPFRKNLPRKLFWWSALLILLCGLLVSLGRAAIGATLVGILVYGWFKSRKSVLVLLVVIAVSVLLIPSIRERMLTLVHPLQHTSGRDSIYLGASKVLWERPILGFGFNTFKAVYPFPNPRNYGNWHNLYLEYYLDLGLVGLALFFYLGFQIFRVGWWILKSTTAKDFQKDMCACILLTMFVLYLMGFFSLSTYDLPMLILHSFYLGILSSLGKIVKDETQMENE